MKTPWHSASGFTKVNHQLRLIAMTLLLLVLGLLTAHPAQADIAPPDRPPGANPVPGNENTHVRMLSETVTMVVQPKGTASDVGLAKVTAIFNMRNLGSTQERMQVRFPLTFFDGSSDGWGNFPEIRDLQVWVNGISVSTRRIETTNPGNIYSNPIPWSAFEVIFPPGTDVVIKVTYTGAGMGDYPYVSFKYVLETGAGWQGTIGSVDLIVRLPYEANIHNVIIDEHTGFSTTTPGATSSGKEIRWHYEDLEPSREHNLEVSLVMPEAWQKVVLEKENVATNPKDGEAWGRLGKAYKEISRFRRSWRRDEGGTELYQLSKAAYEKAVSLLPNDALWHLGFADLLWTHYLWLSDWAELPVADLARAVEELQMAWELSPDHPKIQELLDEISYFKPWAIKKDETGVTFLILTATPTLPSSATSTFMATDTALPTLTLTATLSPMLEPSSTNTALPVETTPVPPPFTVTATPQPTQRPQSPLCGSALLIPAISFLILSVRYLREKRNSSDNLS